MGRIPPSLIQIVESVAHPLLEGAGDVSGCTDLTGLLEASRSPQRWPGIALRVNGRVRARKVRVLSKTGQPLGTMALRQAMTLARESRLDLVEIAPNAKPPLCWLGEYGKFQYEQAK